MAAIASRFLDMAADRIISTQFGSTPPPHVGDDDIVSMMEDDTDSDDGDIRTFDETNTAVCRLDVTRLLISWAAYIRQLESPRR